MNKLIKLTINKKKTIALIAHDGKKEDMIAWCIENKALLQKHNLVGTGTTAGLISKKVGLDVKGFHSGPLGGDQQVGAAVVGGNIDMIIFFADPLEAQPHDPDIRALLRIAMVYDIPMANNKATADFILTSRFMDEEYHHEIVDFNGYIKNRIQ